MKVIFLNGPPRCGKDMTAGYLLSSYAHTYHEKFATPLKQMMKAVYPGYDDNLKDEPNVFNYTGRQIQIMFSEEFMKRVHGHEIFGKLMLERIKHLSGMLVISDAGFVTETGFITKHYPCYLIRIHREGCDFKKDSRSYINLPIPSWDVTNADMTDYFQKIDQIYQEILDHDTSHFALRQTPG